MGSALGRRDEPSGIQAWLSRRRSALWRVVALVALLDLALLLQLRKDPIEVVGLDLHSFPQLADRDAGVRPHEFQGLLRTVSSATGTPWTLRSGRGRCCANALRRARGRPLCPGADALERVKRLADMRVFLNEWLKLT